MKLLLAGQRYSLEDSASFIKVVSGKVEVYAVAANKEFFRQAFLMNLEAGRFAFPAIDNKRIKIIIYAVEDSNIEEIKFDSQSVENLKKQMIIWLKNLTDVLWLSTLADHGDDVLLSWRKGNLFEKCTTLEGKSGCGKSTLIRLLLGFEQPKKGAIYFDGQDLSDVSLASVRSQLGVVLQNGQLMRGDIFTNIVGTRLLSQKDAWEAAEAAGIAEDIASMPMGMQTVISEGSSNISGGQRQRILIARALVNKPSIIIFDEATSALDNHSQSKVAQSLDKLNVTRIIVAHRLSTIRNCDRIIVMDSGHIAEVGTFDELLAKGGIFSELVKRQVV